MPASPLCQNIGRIDHIIFAYRNRENQEKARQKFSALLGISDWDDLGNVQGVNIIISWGSGIELLCPLDGNLDEYLAKHGEGFYGLVFGVANLDQAVAHAERNGGQTFPAFPLGTTPDSIANKFDVSREAMFAEEICGINLLLGEFKPASAAAPTCPEIRLPRVDRG